MDENLQDYLTDCQQEKIAFEDTIFPCNISSMKIGDRIKKYREKIGLSQSELARRIGVKPQAVQAWETGKNGPSRKRGQAIAKELRITEEELEFGTSVERADPSPKGSNPDLLKKMSFILSESRIPLLSDEFREGWGIFPYRSEGIMALLDSPEGASERAFGIRVRGRGMEPEFFEGEIVIVDPALEVQSGDFVVVLLEGQKYALVRRLLVEPDQTRYLEGLHPVYGGAPIPLLSPPLFLGKIIEKRKRY